MPRLCVAFLLALLPIAAATVRAQATEGSAPQDPRDPAGRVDSAAELTQRGQRLVRSGDPGSAVWFLREALRVHPAHAPAAVTLAEIYLARDEPASARDLLLDVVGRSPHHALLWLRLAQAFRALRLGDAATEALRDGLRHSPHDSELLAAAATAALERGEWLRALALQRTLAELRTDADLATSSNEVALRLLVGTSDRARGLRCDPDVSMLRRALSHCSVPSSASPSVSSPTMTRRK